MRIKLARLIMRYAAWLAWTIGGHAAFETDIAAFYASFGKR
jgi:hypothetical protein